MSLSSVIHTRSVEGILVPISKQVDRLVAINLQHIQLPHLRKRAAEVLEAVKQLAQPGITEDEDLAKAIQPGCQLALNSAQQLVSLVNRRSNVVSIPDVHKATQGIESGVKQVILAWDDAEVKNIIDVANKTLDRLKLVLAAKSMRAVVVCYSGFTDSMTELVRLATRRMKDLLIESRKKRIAISLQCLKLTLSHFPQVVQEFVRFPDTSVKRRDALANQISFAIEEIIEAVRKYDMRSEEQPDHGQRTVAHSVKEARTSLAPDQRYYVGSDFNRNIDTVIENSMHVARMSRPKFHGRIQQLCDEAMKLRKDLEINLKVLKASPSSPAARKAVNAAADQLSKKLEELDKEVADSVVDLVADVFVDPSKPIENLVQAAKRSTAPGETVQPRRQTLPQRSTPPFSDELSGDDSLESLREEVTLFRTHSRRLSEVAMQAAQGTLDRKRAKRINETADQLDHLTQKVVEAALEARRDPSNMEAHQRLSELRRQWAKKVQELTKAIDEIISASDFAATSESNVMDDMIKCQEAMNQKDWTKLFAAVHDVAAKSRRVAEVAKASAKNAIHTSQGRRVKEAATNLEYGVEKMLKLANKMMENPSNHRLQQEFVHSLQHVLETIQEIQSLLSDMESAGKAKGEAVDAVMEEPYSTSTPLAFPDKTRAESRPSYASIAVGPLSPVTMSVGTQASFPIMGRHHNLSPSDDWILRSSTESSPSFAPTNTCTSLLPTVPSHPPESFSDGLTHSYGSEEAETQTLQQLMQDKGHQPVLYPASLGPLSVTNPSAIGSSWQTDLSASSVPMSEKPPLPMEDEHLLKSYTQPLQSLLSAAKEGSVTQVASHESALMATADQLYSMAGKMAVSVQDPSLASTLQKESTYLKQLTPQLIRKAKESAQQTDHRDKAKELEVLSHQWVGHVRALVDASQQANLPWSRTSRRLVHSARSRKGLEKQIAHISTQTDRMTSVAMSTIKAAQTEDAIGGIEGSQDGIQDPEIQVQIDHVKAHAEGIKTLTPTLIRVAKEVAEERSGKSLTPANKQLDILSHQWATKASVLLKGVDDVTIGMSGPADSLLISSRSGDPALLSSQVESIRKLADSLENITKDSVVGCANSEQVKSALEAARQLQQVSKELVSCAHELRNSPSDPESEEHQLAIEKAEILRRDWAAKMHLLTAHIDDLTAEVAAPLDRLVSVALQASRTSGMAKEQLMKNFQSKETFINDQLDEVRKKFGETTQGVSKVDDGIQSCARSLAYVHELTPHAIGAAQSLATDPGSAQLDHFSHLRRQWASKAQKFGANLRKIPSVDVGQTMIAWEELLQGQKTARTTPRPVFARPTKSPQAEGREEEEEEEKETSPVLSLKRSYSSEAIMDSPPPVGLPPVDVESQTEGEEASFRGQEELKKKGSDLPGRMIPKQHLSEPPSPSHLSTPELKFRHPHAKSRDHPLRPLSMGAWYPDRVFDTTLNASSASIADAAQSLHELTEEYIEEGNPIIELAKKMSQQMSQMAMFARGKGELQTKSDMIHTAKAIAGNAQRIVQFANAISDQCTDRRMKSNLQYCVEMIPTLSTQLSIIASVKASTPDDYSADIMLVKNAQNLMQAVIKTIQAAEAISVSIKASENKEENEAALLACQWKRKLDRQRMMEVINAPLGARGLRKLNKNRFSTPSLADHLVHEPHLTTSPSEYKHTSHH